MVWRELLIGHTGATQEGYSSHPMLCYVPDVVGVSGGLESPGNMLQGGERAVSKGSPRAASAVRV